jgi:orotidine-5'-phosphate decarboxylase
MTFRNQLRDRIDSTGSHLCVGLDPRPNRIDGDVEVFLRRAVDGVLDEAAAIKPNIAYFEAMGLEGYSMLDELLGWVPDELPVILDVKRSDIPETQKFYARAYLERWDVEALTLNPYTGYDSLAPYLEYEDRGIYLLGVTSNDGGRSLQLGDGETPGIFYRVLEMARRSDHETLVGLVMGLTQMDADLFGFLNDVPLLIPGLGAQGGDVNLLDRLEEDTLSLVNSSRTVLYGDQDRADGSAANERAADYKRRINDALGK